MTSSDLPSNGSAEGCPTPGNEANTELRRAEAALARSEERLALTLAVAGIVGIWDGDLDKGLVYGDANFARIYGVDPAVAARGMPRGAYTDYTHPDDIPLVRDAIDRTFSGAGDYDTEQRIFHPRDGMRWVLTRGRLVRDDAGRPVRFSGISLDITERKLAEGRQAFLLELADALRALSEPAAVLDVALARLGRHLGEHRVGYGRVEPDDATIVLEAAFVDGVAPLTGAFPLDGFGGPAIARQRRGETVICPDVAADPAGYVAATWAAIETRAFVSVPLIRGGRFAASLYVNRRDPHVWTADEVSLTEEVAVRIWDAIERVRSETALRDLNNRLEQMVETRTRERDRLWELSEDLLVTADYAGRLLRISPSWSRLLGHSTEALLATERRALLHPDDATTVRGALAAMQVTGRPVSLELRAPCADGSWRWIAWTLSSEPGTDRFSGIGRDITAARQRQAELAAAQDALRQSQKMEAVGQLTGGLAHDFNNLLAGIQGNLELMATRIAQGRVGDLSRYVESAQGATQRAAALTHRLLAFSRKQTLDPKPIDANRLVAGMAELVQRTVGPSIAVEMAPADDLWPTLIDPNQLENALLNLCINARDAMPDGGRLRITTHNRTVDDGAVRSGDELLPGDYVVVEVEDNGAGMTPDVVARAFDPFFTTKAIGKGTGLGLSMIYGFVRQSGGQARIASRPGDGTTVSVFLPRHHGAAAAVPTDPAASAMGPGSTRHETVLIVDDEPTVRLLLIDVLEELGYITVEAGDGAEGLTRLRERGRVDLLITDVGLPGELNGRQLADAARALQPGLRVLFITGYADGSVIDPQALEAGMQVLIKPFAIAALASCVEAMLAGRDGGGSSVAGQAPRV